MYFNNFDKVGKNIELRKGAKLLSKDHGKEAVFILHEGKVEVLHPEHNELDLSGYPIVEIEEKQYFGYESYLNKSYYTPTFICKVDSIVSVYPFSDLKKLVYNSTEAFCSIVRKMISSFSYFVSYNNRIVEKSCAINEYKHKLSFLLRELNLPTTSSIYFNCLETGAEEMSSFSTEDLLEPANFIRRNHDRPLPYKTFHPRDIYTTAEIFSKKTNNETTALLRKNPHLGKLFFESLLMEYDFVYKFIYENLQILHKEMSEMLFSPDSILEILKNEQQLLPKQTMSSVIVPIFSFLQEDVIQKSFLSQIYEKKQLEEPFSLDGVVEDSEDVDALAQQSADDRRSSIPKNRISIELKENEGNSSGLIIPEKVSEFLKDELKGVEDKVYRLQLREANTFFINTLEVAMMHLSGLSSDEKDAVDPEDKNTWEYLLTEKGVLSVEVLGKSLYKEVLRKRDESQAKIYNFYSLRDWLLEIAKGRIEPSNNEMGFSYRKFIMNEMRTWSTRKKKEYKQKSDKEITKDKLRFEIYNMVSIVFRIMNETPSSAVFAVSKLNFDKSILDFAITKKQIEDVIEEVRDADFSLFYREFLYRLDRMKNLIIQKEVTPNIIIFPGVGHRVVFWQDIVETKKNTRARIIVPRYLIGNLRSAVLVALANFRWEMCKSVKGVGWTNPVDGGLTGAFTDYVTFYKKNVNLSLEAKAKVGELIKNKRNNYKSIFCTKYVDWIEHEQNGVMRLNSVERDFFAKFLPFSKKIREKLGKVPAFEKLIHRGENVAAKKLSTAENALRKTMDEEGNYPEDVKNYLNFLKM